ncbi:MAG: outer membrane protein assembly factor BamB [Pirellulaceae bacterium]|jgi:outer membrane protein assembly factor BamB
MSTRFVSLFTLFTFFISFALSSFVLSNALDSTLQAQDDNRVSASDFGFKTTDWPWWRGPQRTGVADAKQQAPASWSKENVKWSTPIPGRGHGSPTVVGDRIYIASADLERQQQAVHCLDRGTGREVWKTVVHQDGLIVKGNKKASLASSTVACDGDQLYINFLNNETIQTTALNLDGKIQWQKKISNYVVHQGFGSSPVIYKSLVIAVADNKGGGALAGLNRKSGEVVWKIDRPKKPNYCSPVVVNLGGKDQLILMGCDLVSGINPMTGQKFWEFEGATTECVSSMVADGNLVFTSGGYPKNHIAAVKADGTGEVVWENKTRVYVPSMVASNGFLYGVADAGVASCWNAQTGEELWKGRLGGTFDSSPVLVGDKIYAINESGVGFVLAASNKEFKLIAEDKLCDEVFSTPAICGGQIFVRGVVSDVSDGGRQEMLFCLE